MLVVLGICALLIGGISYWLGGAGGSTESDLYDETAEEISLEEDLPAPLTAEELAAYDTDKTNPMNPVAKITTNKGVIELELFADTMPVTTGNFMKLAEEGYYNSTKFHRVIEGFMIQGGDPNTKTDEVMSYGMGGPGYTIADEHIKGEYLTNVRGTISMANSGPQSGGSQFFINLVDNTFLDFDKEPLSSKHPVFGRVVGGMEIVDAIAQVDVNPGNNLPLEAIVVEKVEIVKN